MGLGVRRPRGVLLISALLLPLVVFVWIVQALGRGAL
jgi:hypothetical protein